MFQISPSLHRVCRNCTLLGTSAHLVLEPFRAPLHATKSLETSQFVRYRLKTRSFTLRLRLDVSGELRRMNRDSVNTFMQMLELLHSKQVGVDDKAQHMSHLLFNMVHLLEQLRPHQARQSLIALMHQQVEERNRKAQELEQYVDGYR